MGPNGCANRHGPSTMTQTKPQEVFGNEQGDLSIPPTQELPEPARLGASQFQQNQILKQLRSVEQGLRARLRSIQHDSLRVLNLYHDLFPKPDAALPIFGNARAGSWYVPPDVNGKPSRSCSFKSADGHYGQWSSSLRRPNIHVLEAAAEFGGVVLVDVTRRGKRWPDSFMKTVPIWCAVINIVVDLVDCKCRSRGEDSSDQCLQLHLHPDVPQSERQQILVRFPHWLADWRRSGTFLDQVIPAFKSVRRKGLKPLRPLWVTPDSNTWEGGLPYQELDFTPVVCISGSQVLAYGARSFVEPRLHEDISCQVRFPVCPVGFPYVQGAGDDEEGWCLGLTPRMFWEHGQELMDIADRACTGRSAAEVEIMLRDKIEELLRTDIPMSRTRTLQKSSAPNGIVSIWKTRVSLAKLPPGSPLDFVRAISSHFDLVLILGATCPPEHTLNFPNEGNASDASYVSLLRDKISWFPLRDRKGKIDLKYGFGRSLGPCLSLLRKFCVDQQKQVLVCCSNKNGDWAAGLAIAWLAWQCTDIYEPAEEDRLRCDDSTAGYVVSDERKERVETIPKEKIHSTMLHFSAAFPEFQLSRNTLKQLNRFFSSPAPSSTVSDE